MSYLFSETHIYPSVRVKYGNAVVKGLPINPPREASKLTNSEIDCLYTWLGAASIKGDQVQHMRQQRQFPAVIQYKTRKPDMVIHLFLKIHLTRKVGSGSTDISAWCEKLSTTHSDVSLRYSAAKCIVFSLSDASASIYHMPGPEGQQNMSWSGGQTAQN